MPDIGSAIGLSGANKANDAIQSGVGQAAALQKKMYNQARADEMPYLQTGTAALNTLGTGLGLDTGSPTDAQYYTSLSSQYRTGKKNATGKTVSYYLDPVTGQVTTTLPAAGANGVAVAPLFSANSGYKYNLAGLQTAVNSARAQNTSATTSDPNYGALTKTFTMADFNQDPGYQFNLAQGQKALDRAAAAKGNFLSGAATKGLVDYSQGVASNEFQGAYDRFTNNQNNVYSKLSGVAGIGQGTSQSLAGLGSNYANQQTDLYGTSASSKANKAVSQANIWSTGLNKLGSSLPALAAAW